jgi:hypothetical protein
MPWTHDPETAYEHSWQYRKKAQDATLKIKTAGGDLDPPQYDGYAARRRATQADYRRFGGAFLAAVPMYVWDWWPRKPADTPLAGIDDALVVDGKEYVIRGYDVVDYGPKQQFITLENDDG